MQGTGARLGLSKNLILKLTTGSELGEKVTAGKPSPGLSISPSQTQGPESALTGQKSEAPESSPLTVQMENLKSGRQEFPRGSAGGSWYY